MNSVRERFTFYRDGWRVQMAVTPIVVVALLISLITNAWLVTRPPTIHYFAVESGRLIPMVPLNEPFMSNEDIARWTAEAVTAAYALDFQNIRKQVNDLEKYFTPDGYKSYVSEIDKNGRAGFIVNNWLIASAVPQGPGIIVQEGVYGGAYLWKVQIPMLVTYVSKTEKTAPQKYSVTVVISRMNTWENPRGVGISQFIERAN